MTWVAVIAALGAEARAFERGARGGASIRITLSGVGARAATAAAHDAVGAGASALVSFGCAGGLDPSLEAGTLMLPSRVSDESGRRIAVDPEWRAEVRRSIVPGTALGDGDGLEVRRAVSSVRDKRRLFDDGGFTFVDMESVSVGAVAHAHGLPFLVVRSIADTGSDPLPRAVMRAMTAEGGVAPLRLLAALLRTPSGVFGVAKLWRGLRLACTTLERAADVLSIGGPAIDARQSPPAERVDRNR